MKMMQRETVFIWSFYSLLLSSNKEKNKIASFRQIVYRKVDAKKERKKETGRERESER